MGPRANAAHNTAALHRWSSTCGRLNPGVGEDILGGTRKHLTGHVKPKKKKKHYFVINTE
jgi:hypothetical protein